MMNFLDVAKNGRNLRPPEFQKMFDFDTAKVPFNGRILLVNPLQRSRSTFFGGSLLNFFAFKEGMLDTHISVLWGWPTVSGRFVRRLYTVCRPCQELAAKLKLSV